MLSATRVERAAGIVGQRYNMEYTKLASSRRWETVKAQVVASGERAVVLRVAAPSDLAVIRDHEDAALDDQCGGTSGAGESLRELIVRACGHAPEHGFVATLPQGERASSVRAGGKERDVLIRVCEVGVGADVVRMRWRVKAVRKVPEASAARATLARVADQVRGLAAEPAVEPIAEWLQAHGFPMGDSDHERS